MTKKRYTKDTDAAPLEMKLTADLKKMARELTRAEVRAVVDSYYSMQKIRIGAGNQIGAMEREAAKGQETAEGVEPLKSIPVPTGLLGWLHDAGATIEDRIGKVLDIWTDELAIGRWLKSHMGIGPILAAGLIAHIDIARPNTAECIWSFAGLRPGIVWKKGMKRPFNAKLKTLCWKIVSSFKMQSWRDDCFYGKLYQQRKRYEVERNEAGGQAERAKKLLAESPVKDKDVRAVWESGKLTAGHLDAMAMRWTVKLFLSHMYEVWRQMENLPVAKPFAYSQLKHQEASYIPPPNYPMAA